MLFSIILAWLLYVARVCTTPGKPTYPQNNWDYCCIKFKCVQSDGSWKFPDTLGFKVVTKGSCKQAQGGGVFSSTATRCDLLADGDLDKCKHWTCADVLADGCIDWPKLCGGIRYLWKPSLTGFTIPDCGPFVGGADLSCSKPPPGWRQAANCPYLNTKLPRKGWFTSSFQLFRSDYTPLAQACGCFTTDVESDTQQCNWYYYDADCVLQFGGTYTTVGGVGSPPCPDGSEAYGCICCTTRCPPCELACATAGFRRCFDLVDCCDDPPENSSVCSTSFPITPQPLGDCHCDGTPGYWCNKAGCFGDCGRCHFGRDYRLAFCQGCAHDDDIKGCDPIMCQDPKHWGSFAIRIYSCPQTDEMGNYLSCTAMSAGDYVDWYCDTSVEEMAMHRAWSLLSNGVELADALAATGAKHARPFRPCRCKVHNPSCIFCHSVAYTPGYAESIDRHILGGEVNVSIGFAGNPPPLRTRDGLGTTMAKWFDELEPGLAVLKGDGNCQCADLQSQMNAAGPDGVEKHLPNFAKWLQENARALKIEEGLNELQQQMRDFSGDQKFNIYEWAIKEAIERERERLKQEVEETK